MEHINNKIHVHTVQVDDNLRLLSSMLYSSLNEDQAGRMSAFTVAITNNVAASKLPPPKKQNVEELMATMMATSTTSTSEVPSPMVSNNGLRTKVK